MASVRWQLSQSLFTLAQAACGVLNPVVTVSLRKKLVPDKAAEVQPGVILVSERERFVRGRFPKKYTLGYPFLAVLVLYRGFREEDLRQEADTREAVRLALFNPRPLGPSGVAYDVDYEPEPSFDAGTFGSDFDLTAQRFTYRAEEAGQW